MSGRDHIPRAEPGDVNNLAGFYDRRYSDYYMEEIPAFELAKLRDVLTLLPDSPRRILDFGCGRGRLIGLLGRVFPKAAISGADISPRALEIAARSFPDKEFAPLAGERTPFEDRSFGLVFSYHVLEHVPEPMVSVAEMARLTALGGAALACLPCGDQGSLAFRITTLVRNGRERTPTGEERFFFEDKAHLRRMTSLELVRIFAQNGFDPVAGFFANRFWGELEYLARGGFSRVGKTFPLTRAKTPLSFLKLFSLALPLFLLALPVRLRLTPVGERARTARGFPKKLMWLAFIPLKLLSYPLAAGLEGLARREWKNRRREPGGSAQYFIFRRRD